MIYDLFLQTRLSQLNPDFGTILTHHRDEAFLLHLMQRFRFKFTHITKLRQCQFAKIEFYQINRVKNTITARKS